MNPDHLHPKCSNEKYLTGKELLNMITSFDTIFADNKFDPEQMMEVFEPHLLHNTVLLAETK